ncbi:1-deoxy-D-xylulose-5-phosphate synthase N-terminal domain-containing protein [Tessaracoccus coleopterorum]|uniref:1-deoxy-D-xylulose-5-phosphate synthase N-terminal domain-containing protein n=1 Tax=Tessaracoccus coleopterorum TaxID=2714950 RepID=UPI0018D2C838|nr:1-deoxy-D-xylulose-5-phosphate synthase N-terminal domain-containing protein [Tessaracoccus coleopterorum]
MSEMTPDLAVLDAIQRRVLWLATNMIEVANHRRPDRDGLKVGGHQASCASMVTLMTALYLHHLDADDFVAVKPHGSPVLHSLNYLMGNLDAEWLTELREFGGLQAYPSRTKDPDRVDFSTGSVGLGPAATIFAAGVRDYVDAHFGARPSSRFVAVLGDAELDEGNVWEAVHDPASNALGQVTWLVDFNRQSLDRIVPDVRISPWHAAFAAHGWQVIEVKYGRGSALSRPSMTANPCSSGSTGCPTSATSRSSGSAPPSCGPASSMAHRPRSQISSPACPTTRWRRW